MKVAATTARPQADLARSALGPVDQSQLSIVELTSLTAGLGRWSRCGTRGGGRCCIDAYFQARYAESWPPCPTARWRDIPRDDQYPVLDRFRKKLGRWMDDLDVAAREHLGVLLYDIGNSGRDAGSSVEAEPSRISRQALSELRHRRCFETLRGQLRRPKAGFGWDFLVAMSAYHHINILVYVHLHSVDILDADTEQAKARRAAANPQEVEVHEQPDGTWRTEVYGVTPRLVPCRVVHNWPFVCLLHRCSQSSHLKLKKRKRGKKGGGKEEGKEETEWERDEGGSLRGDGDGGRP